MSGVPERRYTVKEYLAFEREAETKHEFFDGRIYAMSGASLPHIRIVRNLMRALDNVLQGTNCEPLANDMRVRTADNFYTYPDVVVVCGKPELEDDAHDTLLNPRILIEVLSPSTENYDRVRKFDKYRTITTVSDYVMVAQDRPQVIQAMRQTDNTDWLTSWRNGLDDVLNLKFIARQIPLREIYRQIDFPEDLPLLRSHDPHASDT
jgi:Uma2 family endonuclease